MASSSSSYCILRRLFYLRPLSFCDIGATIMRRRIRFQILKSKSTRWWLHRLAGLGTGLSLCAKPLVIPAEEEKKLLDIDPKSLTHSSLVRNAATVVVDAASALVSQSVIAAIELHQQHAQHVYELIRLYEQHITMIGAPMEEDVWQEIIGERVKADDARRAALEVETVLEAAIRTLEHAGEAAYQAGSETASLIAGQRVTLAMSQLEVAKAVSSNALQELASVQELSITVTSKHAEQESEEGQQQAAETAAA
ncbi:diablo IAP-binding mitochondrial protein-like [Amphiura filiformis]|uniref:diablo IAP-binding mitochondrial protein-like n=1 Tax=Amphiura filiformis TaxID=82378 RepID=UPI003B21F0F3